MSGVLSESGLCVLLLGMVGCAPGSESAPDAEESGDTCSAAAEATSWDNWGAGFFAGYCRTCHAADSPDRRGAPVALNFDTEAEVVAQAANIERAVLVSGSMPVGGGVPEAELERLAAFLECGR